MASIGELTATVRADVSGFVGPMQQVVTTTQRTASQVQSIVAPTQQLGQQLGQTATAGKLFGVSLGSLRGSLASLVSGLAGVPGPLGNIASKLAMFGAGGGVTVAVLAGVAATVAIFKKLTDATKKQDEAVDGLVEQYNEMFGATVRLNRELARQAVADAQRGRLQVIGTSLFGMPMLARITNAEELTRATQALQAAERAYAEHNRKVAEPGLRAAADAAKAYADALEEAELAVKRAKDKGVTNTTPKEQPFEEAFDRTKPKDIEKQLIDNSAVVQGARDAASAMSQAFMAAFTESKESLTERIASVLSAAVRGAIQRLIEQKLFEVFLKAFSPVKGPSIDIPIIGPLIGGLLGAPPPMAASSGTLIVPLDALPPPISPIEAARDHQHQMLWMETARQAESNGFRLSVRTR